MEDVSGTVSLSSHICAQTTVSATVEWNPTVIMITTCHGFFFFLYYNFFFNTVAVESDTINKANSEPSDMQSSLLVCRRDTFHYDVCQLPAKIHNIMHITQQNPQFGRRGAQLMTSLQCRNVAKSSR